MQKKTYKSINLACTLQQDDEITTDKCLNGVISKTTEGFRFEEAVRKGRPKRNPKLFDGKFCSLVHMANGKYQIHMKTIDASGELDRQELAFIFFFKQKTAYEVLDGDWSSDVCSSDLGSRQALRRVPRGRVD